MSTTVLCRICGMKKDAFVNVYEEDGISRELDTKMSSCLQIWVSPKDVLPITVCLNCCDKLDELYEFLETSKKAQVLLKEIYESAKNAKKIETEFPSEIEIDYKSLADVPCEYMQDHNAKGSSNTEVDEKNESSKIPKGTDSKDEGNKHGENSVPTTLEESSEHFAKSDSDVGETEDELMPLLPVRRKSNRRKKDMNLCDIPRNPRLTGVLQGYPWYCAVCEDTLFSNLEELCEHYKSDHNQSPIFKCITCQKQYDRYRSFVRHIKYHQDPKKYTCETCGKSFMQRAILQSHATVHSDERPHVCSTCGKSFKNFSSLFIHSKGHLPDQMKEKFPCEFCQKEFSTKHAMETHRKIHTGERNFMCDICGQSFIAKGSLDYHLLSHNGDKSHVCTTCGRSFKTSRLLNKHLTLHAVVKPYQCDVCGKQFRERGALKEHNRIHTGAMPYRCEFCGKNFRFRGILTVHRRQHTGERPYSCMECRRSFTNWANYNKHMKRIHHCDTSNPENSRRRAAHRAISESTDANVIAP